MEDGVIFPLPSVGEFITNVLLTFTIKLGVQLPNYTRVDGMIVKVMLSESRFQ